MFILQKILQPIFFRRAVVAPPNLIGRTLQHTSSQHVVDGLPRFVAELAHFEVIHQHDLQTMQSLDGHSVALREYAMIEQGEEFIHHGSVSILGHGFDGEADAPVQKGVKRGMKPVHFIRAGCGIGGRGRDKTRKIQRKERANIDFPLFLHFCIVQHWHKDSSENKLQNLQLILLFGKVGADEFDENSQGLLTYIAPLVSHPLRNSQQDRPPRLHFQPTLASFLPFPFLGHLRQGLAQHFAQHHELIEGG
mmetsp:Transcript_18234/g.41581  ORF Transcript_18234/g.41581 Transcript_18234/m.41581 type:complete len:250 (-) Transcript_18234:5025-5774(-)